MRNVSTKLDEVTTERGYQVLDDTQTNRLTRTNVVSLGFPQLACTRARFSRVELVPTGMEGAAAFPPYRQKLF